jgi:oxygen-independent coproporphyrinogen III oxidase
VALGIYISVPFCRTKCSYCNFASDVFSSAAFDSYVERLCRDIANAHQTAEAMGGKMESDVDSIYLGGGTPTVLTAAQLERIFAAIRHKFEVVPQAEITVECAPGTLTGALIDCLLKCGVNRLSLGVQSFVDQEAAAVGRRHNRTIILQDIDRLRAAGITNLNIDLIAGLPHQTPESWNFSVSETIATGVPHVSVYMLEVDEDSRLGRELLAGGSRYHAHFVPDDEATTDFYLRACEQLQSAGIAQYEISNFALNGFESLHNLKYWTRQPYLGFGVDAHSMLTASNAGVGAIRFSTPDSLEQYMGGKKLSRTDVSKSESLEESFFLGLRLNRGVDLQELAGNFSEEQVETVRPTIAELIHDGLMQREANCVRLTSRGRLLSNEVFQRFISPQEVDR